MNEKLNLWSFIILNIVLLILVILDVFFLVEISTDIYMLLIGISVAACGNYFVVRLQRRKKKSTSAA
jgi:hypothetical protein